MSIPMIVNCCLISVGAIIMLISIVWSKELMKTLPFVAHGQRRQVTMYLKIHRVLMIFFLCGYLVVLVAFIFHYSFISETFVSLIFMFGAIFVLVGIVVQTRLLAEVHSTLQGILPICCKCKKIRAEGSDRKDPKAWMGIENYISERTNVDFSHGYCPECFAKEVLNMRKSSLFKSPVRKD
jgi:hypothetical protein